MDALDYSGTNDMDDDEKTIINQIHWEDLTPEHKMERLRYMVKDLKNIVEVLLCNVNELQHHKHNEQTGATEEGDEKVNYPGWLSVNMSGNQWF